MLFAPTVFVGIYVKLNVFDSVFRIKVTNCNFLYRGLFAWHIAVYILGIYLNIELVFPVKTNKYFSHFGKKR